MYSSSSKWMIIETNRQNLNYTQISHLSTQTKDYQQFTTKNNKN